jgi:hypothetical protein
MFFWIYRPHMPLSKYVRTTKLSFNNTVAYKNLFSTL